MIKYFADTSALLHQPLNEPVISIGISPLTVAELEHIKEHEEDKKIQYLAREAVRALMTNEQFTVIMPNNKTIDKLLKKYKFLSNINDHRILLAAEALAIEQGRNIIFLTSDALQYLFAQQLPHLDPVYPMGEELAFRKEEEWAGWGKYYPAEKEMSLLYSDPKINSLGCKTNEFAEIFDKTELKDVLFWDGHQYGPLKYKDIKNPYIGETIKPRNLE